MSERPSARGHDFAQPIAYRFTHLSKSMSHYLIETTEYNFEIQPYTTSVEELCYSQRKYGHGGKCLFSVLCIQCHGSPLYTHTRA